MRWGPSGQQLTEFALVIGIVALAAISMQYLVRRSMQRGIQAVSDDVLGPPVQNPNQKTASLLLTAGQTAVEQGSATFQRTTDTNDQVGGVAINQAARLQVIPDVGKTPTLPSVNCQTLRLPDGSMSVVCR